MKRRLNVNVEPANLDTLGEDWAEIDYALAPQAEAWVPFIEAGKNSVLIARETRLNRAVGTVAVRWLGPSYKWDRGFRRVLREHYGTARIPVSYGLWVPEEHRRNGIARQLMEGVEQQAALRPEEIDRLALSVEVDNEAAARLYMDIGYKIRKLYRHKVPTGRDPETGEFIGEMVNSWIMTKDLPRVFSDPLEPSETPERPPIKDLSHIG